MEIQNMPEGARFNTFDVSAYPGDGAYFDVDCHTLYVVESATVTSWGMPSQFTELFRLGGGGSSIKLEALIDVLEEKGIVSRAELP